MTVKALEAGINYHEFRYREADFGGYPKGLMYGLQILDSWLYDDEEALIHVDALDVFAFLKEKLGTGYYEELIRRYLAGESPRRGGDRGTEAGQDSKNGRGSYGKASGIQRKPWQRGAGGAGAAHQRTGSLSVRPGAGGRSGPHPGA